MATKKKTSTKTGGSRAPATRKKTAAKGPAGRAAPARKKTAARAPARKRAKLPAPPPTPPAQAENPKARALAQRMARLLSDKKALDIIILDVRGLTSYADYFVIASGESDRQVNAMAEHVQVQLKETEGGLRAIGSEGLETGQWVLLDYGEVVAHLFLTEVRSHYDIEGLWADAPREKVA